MRRKLAFLTVITLASNGARAQFFEGFDGSFESSWGTFPFANMDQTDAPFFFFEGFPNGSFTQVDGESVFRMTNGLSTLQFMGMSPDAYIMDGTEGVIEARINTMAQNGQGSGGPFSIRILSPGGDRVTVGLFNSDDGIVNRFRFGSTIDNNLNTVVFSVQDHTWYRVILDNTGPALRAIIRDDAGFDLISHTFSHPLSALQGFGTALHLAVVQDSFVTPMDLNQTRDVAIDWISVSDGCPADFAPPFGVMNFFDLGEFLALFNAQDPAADLAAPFGVWNFFDLGEFLSLFNQGCP